MDLLAAVSWLDIKSINLQVRVGIATGLVIVGDLLGEGSAQEQSVVGETPNLAARLQALATPSSLVIASSTRQQIGELFELEDLGPQRLPRFVEPQRAWRVLGESDAVSRFEALLPVRSPLVGRDEEVELLLRPALRQSASASPTGRRSEYGTRASSIFREMKPGSSANTGHRARRSTTSPTYQPGWTWAPWRPRSRRDGSASKLISNRKRNSASPTSRHDRGPAFIVMRS